MTKQNVQEMIHGCIVRNFYGEDALKDMGKLFETHRDDIERLYKASVEIVEMLDRNTNITFNNTSTN